MTLTDFRDYARIDGHLNAIFASRRYASAVLSAILCPSFYPSVRLSHAGILPKRLNVESHKQRRTIAHRLSFQTPTVVGGRPPFPRNVFERGCPFEHNDFDQYPLIVPQR